MGADAIVDTGAILALLDKKDRWHQSCANAFLQIIFPLLTSEAVLTEVFHLIKCSRTELNAVWTLLRSGAIVLAGIDNSELPQIEILMSRHRDRPMDFADATIFYLAGREAISSVLTVDQNDFATYRIAGKRRFQILPLEGPKS